MESARLLGRGGTLEGHQRAQGGRVIHSLTSEAVFKNIKDMVRFKKSHFLSIGFAKSFSISLNFVVLQTTKFVVEASQKGGRGGIAHTPNNDNIVALQGKISEMF